MVSAGPPGLPDVGQDPCTGVRSKEALGVTADILDHMDLRDVILSYDMLSDCKDSHALHLEAEARHRPNSSSTTLTPSFSTIMPAGLDSTEATMQRACR
jgi:hypothetical protein